MKHSPRTGRHFFRVVVPTGFAALGLALAACGSSGSSSPAAAAGPKLQPSAYVLTSGPATNGYKGEADSDTTEATAFQDPVPKCMHLSGDDLGPASTDHANGETFTSDDGTSINSGARVFASADVVTKHVALVQRADFPNCLAQAVQSSLSDSGGATIRSATAATPPAGATALTRLVFNVTSSSSGDIEVNFDLVSIFKGRVESVILVVNPLLQTSTDTLNALTQQVVGKVGTQ